MLTARSRLHLTARLAARGDAVTGLIRNPDHAEEVRAAGADPVVCDLERATVPEVAAAIAGAEAVVFAAGAGAGSGGERKLTVDRDGAIKLLGAATEAGAGRYLIVSSIGAENPPDGDDVFSIYLRAKAEADAALAASDRTGRSSGPGRSPTTPVPAASASTPSRSATGSRVRTSRPCSRPCSHDAPVSRKILYLGGGQDPIDEALERARARPRATDDPPRAQARRIAGRGAGAIASGSQRVQTALVRLPGRPATSVGPTDTKPAFSALSGTRRSRRSSSL